MESETFYHLQTNEIVNISSELRSHFATIVDTSYQVREKLCIMASVGYVEKTIGTMVGSIKCNGFNADLNVFCEFRQKIKVRLHGLCKMSPVDRQYVLVKAKREEYEGASSHDYYRYGTFLGTVSSYSS